MVGLVGSTYIAIHIHIYKSRRSIFVCEQGKAEYVNVQSALLSVAASTKSAGTHEGTEGQR